MNKAYTDVYVISSGIQVIHPGVKRQVEMDLLLMKMGSWLLHCLPGLKWLSLCEIVDEFEKLMTKQVGIIPHSILKLRFSSPIIFSPRLLNERFISD